MIFSIEGFKQAVKDEFGNAYKTPSKEQFDEYFDGEEANREVERAYIANVKKYEDGKITERIFREECVASVAYCLYLMY